MLSSLEIAFSTDLPMKISCNLDQETENYLNFYLSPRVEEEEGLEEILEEELEEVEDQNLETNEEEKEEEKS